MALNRITFQVSNELIQAIESRANVTGIDKTDVVIQTLKQAFGISHNEVSQATDIKQASLQKQEHKELKELSKLKTRLSELEKRVASQTEQIAKLGRTKLLRSSTEKNMAALSEHLIELVTQFPSVLPSVEEAKPQVTKDLVSNYIQIDDFLTIEERSRLFDYVLQQESAFVPTYTLTGAPDHRRSLVLYSLSEFSELIINRIQTIIPYILTKLEVPLFSISQIESQLTAHNDGNYYKLHNDDGVPDISNRKVSYVYYFHQEAKPFSGGELLIYDSKVENKFYLADKSFKTVEPRNNSIVFFLSRHFHEVLPVVCPSKAFSDSRFTINGWIRQ